MKTIDQVAEDVQVEDGIKIMVAKPVLGEMFRVVLVNWAVPESAEDIGRAETEAGQAWHMLMSALMSEGYCVGEDIDTVTGVPGDDNYLGMKVVNPYNN